MSKTLEIKILTQLQDKLSAPLKKIQSSSKNTENAFKALNSQLRDLKAQNRNIDTFQKLQKDLTSSGAKLDLAKAKLEDLKNQLSATAAPSKTLTAQLQNQQLAVQKAKEAHADKARKLSEVKNKLESAGISTNNLAAHEANLTNKIKSANAELKQHEAVLARTAETQRKLSDAKAKMQNTQQFAANMAVTGAAGYMSGKKVLTSMAGVMNPGIDFESSMSKVQSLTRLDKDSKELTELQEQARKLGASTMFTATQAADAQGFLAMAGFTPEAIKQAMPGMLDMAKAGGLELARAADISSNILSGMNLDSNEMGRVGDVLVGAFTRSNTNLEMLGDTMKYAAPMAAALKVDIETLAAATGKLGDAGIQGSMAGTALRSILNRLSAPPKAAEKALKKLKIQTKDSKGNLRDFTEILQELDKKTKHMGDAERAGYFKAIAGEEAVSALTVLVEKSGGDLQKLRDELYKSSGEASKVATKMADNLVGDLDKLKSAWEDIGIAVFYGQKGILRDFVQKITDVVSAVGVWIEKNPELAATIVKVVATIAAIVAGMGALAITVASIIGPFAILKYALSYIGITAAGGVGIFGKLAAVFGIVKTAIFALGRALLMNPIGLIITAIGGLAYLLWDNWDWVTTQFSALGAWFGGIWDSIKSAFDAGTGSVINTLLAWTPLGLIINNWSAITDFFKNLWEDIKSWFTGGISDTDSLLSNWNPLSIITGIFTGVASAIEGIWSGITNTISRSISSISNSISTLDISGSISRGIDSAKTFIGEQWDTVSKTTSGLWDGVVDLFSWGSKEVSTEISSWDLARPFTDIWGDVSSFFSQKTSDLTTAGGDLVSGLVDGIRSHAELAKLEAIKLAESVTNAFKNAMAIKSPSRVFKALGAFIPEGAAEGIQKAQGVAINAARTMAVAVTAAGAMTPATANNIKFDQRPALNLITGHKPSNVMAGDTINITINASGNNAPDIARLVKQEIERLQAQKQARSRSSYNDYGY